MGGEIVGTDDSSTPTGYTTVCPLACSPSCPWRCPTTISDAIDNVLFDMAVAL